MVKLLAERAPAKINLFLRVTGRRANGYHELDSIFLPLALADRVRIEIRPALDSTVGLICDAAALASVESNLAARAAAAFMSEYGQRAQVRIDLQKRIPVGAGLGGGSSDAGAVLRMMAALCGVASDDRLAAIAEGLGADVPFFLDSRPARMSGIGERRHRLGTMPALELVLAVPPTEVPTGKIFAALGREQWSGPAPERDIEQILAGRIDANLAVNDLYAPAARLYPEIARLRSILQQEGASVVQMSGSGGAVFGLFPDKVSAERAAQRVRNRAPEARVVATRTAAGADGDSGL